jgi:hypothetical protein
MLSESARWMKITNPALRIGGAVIGGMIGLIAGFVTSFVIWLVIAGEFDRSFFLWAHLFLFLVSVIAEAIVGAISGWMSWGKDRTSRMILTGASTGIFLGLCVVAEIEIVFLIAGVFLGGSTGEPLSMLIWVPISMGIGGLYAIIYGFVGVGVGVVTGFVGGLVKELPVRI